MTKMEMQDAPRVAVIMGSKSDWATMQRAAELLAEFGVPYEAKVVSAHRTPDFLFDYVGAAEARGIQVIIAGAGGRGASPGHGGSKDDSAGARSPDAIEGAPGIGLTPVHRADAQGRTGGHSGDRETRGGERRAAGCGHCRAR